MPIFKWRCILNDSFNIIQEENNTFELLKYFKLLLCCMQTVETSPVQAANYDPCLFLSVNL